MSDNDSSQAIHSSSEPKRTVRGRGHGSNHFFTRVLNSLAAVASPHETPLARSGQLMTRCHELMSGRGEVSGAKLASEVLADYCSLSSEGRELFFDLLVDEFSPDPEKVNRAADQYRAAPSQASLMALISAVEPPRQELFRRFNMAPGGTALLVDMRKQLLSTLDAHPNRVGLDADLTHLLRSWFNRGFLLLQRIDWRTSALVLERLIEYEAVHQIQGWHDLRRRLQADRRCYAFFHSALPDEPLIFIEVALAQGLSATVQPLLAPDSVVVDPKRADCAVFYSITNCQEGLRGVSFGNFLIKQVVEDLGRSFPRLQTFATLSPIPGFRQWLNGMDLSALPKAQSTEVRTMLGHLDQGGALTTFAISPKLRDAVLQLCAQYLLTAKRGAAPLDPVARFHLANGARLERLNWMGDTSKTGVSRSLGMTVNYVYSLNDVERNHEAYANAYRVVASRRLERLAGQRGKISGKNGDSQRAG